MKLSDLVRVKHGFAFKGEHFVDEPTPHVLVTPGNFAIGGGFQDTKLKFYRGPVPEDYALKPGDLVVTMTDLSRGADTLGYSAVVPKADGRVYLHNQRIGLVEVLQPRRIVKSWLHYLLRTAEYRAWVIGSASGSTVKHTSPSRICDFEFELPTIQTQEEAAVTLDAIEARIDLLRQTNTTLESIAQALFKSWFVDFDPVRAKQAGREPEGMDAATAALFPAEFEESGLGLIPKGWSTDNLVALSESIFSGGTPDTRKAEYWGGELPWFSSGETRESVVIDTEKRISQLAVDNSSARLAKPGDILIASAGQGHTRGQTSYCAMETYINQSVVSVRTDWMKGHPAWTFYNLSRRYEEMRALSDSHSIRGSLTTKLLASMRVVIPPVGLMHAFGSIAESLLAAQAENRRRSKSLAGLRDTLLPRLISGKLRLPEAQEQLEDALA